MLSQVKTGYVSLGEDNSG